MIGDDDHLGRSLAGRMFDRRIVFLHGELDDRRAGELAMALMTLDAEGDDPISLQVDCSGGTLDAALAVVDTIGLLGVPVHATCVGRVEGSACAVVAVCDHRRASGNTRFRLSAPNERFEGNVRDASAQLDAIRSRMDRFVAALSRATGHPLDDVARDVGAGRSFDAEEALRYGLVDEVIDRPDAEVVRLPTRDRPRRGD